MTHPIGDPYDSMGERIVSSSVTTKESEVDVLANFKKGQSVNLLLIGGGFTTKERKKVLRVDDKGVWLDNGCGNDPSGPFDPMTGIREPLMLGWSQRIEPRATRAAAALTQGA